MKTRSLCALLFCALLAGCGTTGAASSGTADSAAVEAPPAVTTEEQVRALYENDEDYDSFASYMEVIPYEGDFLVCFAGDGLSTHFDWVYGSTGIRRSLVGDIYGLARYEILGHASIRFLTDGVRTADGHRCFPNWVNGNISSLYDADGLPLNYDVYGWSSGSQTEPYWSPLTEAHSFGMFGRREAVSAASVEVDGLGMSFAPLADSRDFDAAYCDVPGTDIAYDEAAQTLSVTCHDTFLDSGELTVSAAEAGYDEEYLRSYYSLYPEDFPAGALEGSCPLIESAGIAQAGDDVVVTLKLTRDDIQYTVESGYQGPMDIGPYFRVVLQVVSDW